MGTKAVNVPQTWESFWHGVCHRPLRYLGPHAQTLSPLLGHGKGVRSKKVYDVATFLGTLTPDHITFAAALEHIHAASLCHDDVLDNGQTRRGHVCVHRTQGCAQAILLGDALMAEGFGALVSLEKKAVMPLACQCFSDLVEGQMEEHTLHDQSTQDSYLHMIAKKTGALFGLAFQGAGLIAGTPDTEAHILYTLGCEEGIAYQLYDDCWDYEQPVDQWDAGHDCLQKKWTLPLLHALQNDRDNVHNALHAVWSNPENTNERAHLVDCLRASLDHVRNLGKDHQERVQSHMAHITLLAKTGIIKSTISL